MQFLAGPRDVRTGVFGLMLRSIAGISLIIGPVLLLVFFQLQFLPYHDPVVSWWQRIAVLLDLVLLWILWPRIVRHARLLWGRVKIGFALVFSALPLLLVFLVATFPGEWLNETVPAVPRFVPTSSGKIKWEWLDIIRQGRFRDIPWEDTEPATPYEFFVGGKVNEVALRQTSWWSNRLIVPGIDLREIPKFDTAAKIEVRPRTASLRGRRLEDVVLSDAYLPKADFTGAELRGVQMSYAQLQGASLVLAQLQGAALDHAQLQDAWFDEAQLQGASLLEAQLQSASLDHAQLQGASLVWARLQGASLNYAQLQGASLGAARLQGASLRGARLQSATLDAAQLQGASLDGAQLQGASLRWTQLQGASLDAAELQGAFLDKAQLQGASLRWTQLQSTTLDMAQLQAAWLDSAWLQGASLRYAQLQGAWLANVMVWRAKFESVADAGAYVENLDASPLFPESYVALRRLIVETVPAGAQRNNTLNRIADLNPDQEAEWKFEQLGQIPKDRLTLEQYRTNLVSILRNIGCEEGEAPFVVKSLFRQTDFRFRNDPVRAGDLASKFLDEKECPGAHGLSDDDRTRLRKIRDSAPPRLP